MSRRMKFTPTIQVDGVSMSHAGDTEAGPSDFVVFQFVSCTIESPWYSIHKDNISAFCQTLIDTVQAMEVRNRAL